MNQKQLKKNGSKKATSKNDENSFNCFLESQKNFTKRVSIKVQKERENRDSEIPSFRPSILEVMIFLFRNPIKWSKARE